VRFSKEPKTDKEPKKWIRPLETIETLPAKLDLVEKSLELMRQTKFEETAASLLETQSTLRLKDLFPFKPLHFLDLDDTMSGTMSSFWNPRTIGDRERALDEIADVSTAVLDKCNFWMTKNRYHM